MAVCFPNNTISKSKRIHTIIKSAVMKYFILLLLLPTVLHSQISRVPPSTLRVEKLVEINERKRPITELTRYSDHGDTLYSWAIYYHDELNFIKFSGAGGTLDTLCQQFRYHLNASYHTNHTFDLGNSRITLVSEKDKKGRHGVQIICQQGIITLWEDDALRLFCN